MANEKQPKSKSPKKQNENLSKKDIKDLMKSSTPILHKKRGGAWG